LFKISKHILDFFITRDKLSAARLYFYIKSKLNNHLHTSDYNQLLKDLNISLQVLYKNLRQLKELGICTKLSDNYTRIHSWSKWCPTNKNRIIDLSLEKLSNLKVLRTLHYFFNIRSSVRCAKKNSKREKKQASSGFYPASYYFIKKVTFTPQSITTIAKHLKRSQDFGFLSYKNDFITYMSSYKLSECLQAKKILDLKEFYPYKIKGKYFLRSFSPNLIRC